MIQIIKKYTLKFVVLSLSLSVMSCAVVDKDLTMNARLQQATFTSPEQAAKVFVAAIADKDAAMLDKLLGADFRDVLPVGDISEQDIASFVTAWEEQNTLITGDEQTRFIAIGQEQWTFPFPIVTDDNKAWFFDVEQGVENMTVHRIGRNELYAIQAILTYRHAQIEYAENDHDGDGKLAYAQKLFSSAGLHDGLLWEGNTQKQATLLASLLAQRDRDGSYHGYQYKILHSAHSKAEKGLNHHSLDEATIESFALIVWPESYGESGIMTFILNKDGTVFEQDLGEATAEIAETVVSYKSTDGWLQTDEDSLAPQ